MLNKKILYGLLCFSLLFTACGETSEDPGIRSSFDSPFPKRPVNLTFRLGESFTVQEGSSPVEYKISFDRANRHNYIVNTETSDTAFAGIICRYRGLYYFNQAINDSTYWIYAVKIGGEEITGLFSAWQQMSRWDSLYLPLFEPGGEAKLPQFPMAKYNGEAKDMIRMTPDKHVMQTFYEALLDSMPSEPLLRNSPPLASIIVEEFVSSERLQAPGNGEIVAKYFPNPAVDHCTVELASSGPHEYGIYNPNGQLIRKGLLPGLSNYISPRELKPGRYFLRVYSAFPGEAETVQLIVSDQEHAL
ncbi:MAG: T9SS type A sorting domain-containing protein [Flavobacteriales bacterium]|nr:T9SS type A sorting domain-containing protein [Flavobacteriales bacterium]